MWNAALAAALTLSLAAAASAQPKDETVRDLVGEWPAVRVNHVVVTQAGVAQPLLIPGRFQKPAGATGRVPAVLILHGSAGVDSRGLAMAAALNRAGFATLELDMWGPRGLGGGATGRPASPADTLPDVYGAFRWLAARPDVDAGKIGITGFSWGGVLAMLTATKAVDEAFLPGPARFAAHAPFYPVCYLYNNTASERFSAPWRDLTGAPVRIYQGAADHYDDADPQACESARATLAPADRAHVSVRAFPGATHGFDMLTPRCSAPYDDPSAHRGKGGPGRSCPDFAAGMAAREDAAQFFARAFTR